MGKKSISLFCTSVHTCVAKLKSYTLSIFGTKQVILLYIVVAPCNLHFV